MKPNSKQTLEQYFSLITYEYVLPQDPDPRAVKYNAFNSDSIFMMLTKPKYLILAARGDVEFARKLYDLANEARWKMANGVKTYDPARIVYEALREKFRGGK